MANRSSKFGVGLMIGTAIGAVAAYFLSPRSGKENREMAQKKMKELQSMMEDGTVETRVKEIYGDASDKSKKAYQQLRTETKSRMGQIQKALEDLDVEKYKGEVTKIVETLQKDGGAAELVEKARTYLLAYVDKMAGNEELKKKVPAKKAADDRDKKPAKPAKKDN